MKKIKFLRSDTVRHLRIGKKRKKLQKWRRPSGRHSKIRRKRFSYPKQPSIGYKMPRGQAGLVGGKRIIMAENIRDLEHATKDQTVIISRRVGTRKRIEMLKKSEELQLIVMGSGGKNEIK